ncbi:MAG: hypothetical protein WCF65_02700 [Parachlamydiaceae bacterium]
MNKPEIPVFLPTYLMRHRKENLKKCSLRGLEERADCRFLTYPCTELPDLSSYVLLAIDAPPLTTADADCGIFLLDATWRLAGKMLSFVESKGPVAKRSIPGGFKTAYPRRQEDCPNPGEGLASVEALYLAYCIMGRNPEGILDAYHWKEQFLAVNFP